ncbi:MAG TPA: CBS domain-containing protein [Acidimicrobiales bacterium]|jgi:CBS domain-containing protein|nr:CBS domain-containing protein [Acidimicrobiales bacterium]
MRTVRDVMSGHIEVLRTSETVAEAASYLASHGQDSVPLCLSDGSLAGTVSNRDIVSKVVAKGLDPHAVRLEQLAEPGDVLALEAGATVEDAVAYMCRHRRTRLPVIDGNRVIGLVTQRDVARSVSFHPSWVDS